MAGAPDVTSTAFGGGLNKAISGTLETASPLIPGALWNAPVSTALTLGSAMGVTDITDRLLRWAGVSPEWSGAWSNLAGLLGAGWTLKRMRAMADLTKVREGNAIQAKLNEIAERAQSPDISESQRNALRVQATALIDAVRKTERGPNGFFLPQVSFRDLLPENGIRIPPPFPNPNMAEREAYGYMRKDVGTAPDAGMATGSPMVRGGKFLSGYTPAGAYMDARAKGVDIEALRTHANRLLGEAQPEDGSARAHYAELDRITDDVKAVDVPLFVDKDGSWVHGNVKIPVDIRDLKIELQPLYEKMQFMPMAERSASRAYATLKALLDSHDFIPGPTAEFGLGQFKAAARSEGGGVSEALAKRIIPHLQALVDGAFEGHAGDEAVAALQRGRAAAAKEAGADWLGEQFKKAQQEGGFGHEKALWNSWVTLKDTAKRTMFNAQQIAELNKFFLGLKMRAENPNPSGTALVGAVAAQAGAIKAGGWVHPMFWLGELSIAGISKLLRSDRGVRWLTEGLTIPGNSERGRFISRKLKAILGEANGTPPPESGPPAGGGQPGPGPTPPTGGGARVVRDAPYGLATPEEQVQIDAEATRNQRPLPPVEFGGEGQKPQSRAQQLWDRMKDEEGSLKLGGGEDEFHRAEEGRRGEGPEDRLEGIRGRERGRRNFVSARSAGPGSKRRGRREQGGSRENSGEEERIPVHGSIPIPSDRSEVGEVGGGQAG